MQLSLFRIFLCIVLFFCLCIFSIFFLFIFPHVFVPVLLQIVFAFLMGTAHHNFFSSLLASNMFFDYNFEWGEETLKKKRNKDKKKKKCTYWICGQSLLFWLLFLIILWLGGKRSTEPLSNLTQWVCEKHWWVVCALSKQGSCCSNHSLRKGCFSSFITGFSRTNTASKHSWYLRLILNIHVSWTLHAFPFLHLSASLHVSNEKVLSLLWSIITQVRENCEHLYVFILNWYSLIFTSLHSLCWDRTASDWVISDCARVINNGHVKVIPANILSGSPKCDHFCQMEMHQILDLTKGLIEMLLECYVSIFFIVISGTDIVVITRK